MRRRVLLMFVAIGGVIVFGWGTSGEAHRSGCHSWQGCPPHHSEFSGLVVRIIDGDTIEVMHQGKAEKIRLAGIDSREKQQAFGTQAKQYTSALAFGKEVTVKIVGQHRDRAIGEVILPDGNSLNRELVKAGFAWWYQCYAPHDSMLQQLQAEAQANRWGLWIDAHPIPPWEFRKQKKAKASNYFPPQGGATQAVGDALEVPNTIEVCFTPQQDCEARVLHEIAQARERILVQAYRLTSVPIAQALIAANAHDVYVAVLLDRAHPLQEPAIQQLLASPIPVYQETRHKYAHSKIMLIDQRILTGSYNWTDNAHCWNAENLVILVGTLLPEYEANWTYHLRHATRVLTLAPTPSGHGLSKSDEDRCPRHTKKGKARKP